MTLGLNLSAGYPLKRLSGGQLKVPNVSDQSKPAVTAGHLHLRLPKSPGGNKVNSHTSPISAWPRWRSASETRWDRRVTAPTWKKANQHSTPIKNQGKNNKKRNQHRLAGGSAVAYLSIGLEKAFGVWSGFSSSCSRRRLVREAN
jgi:hypothetical protein